MLEAVIFDVDGTLIDSVDIHAQAWQDAFGDFGHEIPFDDIRGQIGKGGDQPMPVFLSREELETKGVEIERWRGKILRERYFPKLRAFPGVRELFQRMKRDGIKIALASSAKEDELAFYKKVAQIEDLVDIETSSDDAERSKPYPDIFEAALSRLRGMNAGDAIVVGDTPYDAEAAGKAGLRTIGVLCGGFPEAALRRAGCIAIFPNPADLLAHYREWTGEATASIKRGAAVPAPRSQESTMPKQDTPPQVHMNFDAPLEVVVDPALSKPEKAEVLEQLEQDARQLAIASGEGMSGGEPTALAEVLHAKEALDLPAVDFAYALVLKDLEARRLNGDSDADSIAQAVAALEALRRPVG